MMIDFSIREIEPFEILYLKDFIFEGENHFHRDLSQFSSRWGSSRRFVLKHFHSTRVRLAYFHISKIYYSQSWAISRKIIIDFINDLVGITPFRSQYLEEEKVPLKYPRVFRVELAPINRVELEKVSDFVARANEIRAPDKSFQPCVSIHYRRVEQEIRTIRDSFPYHFHRRRRIA